MGSLVMAAQVTPTTVTLSWTVPGDDGTEGTASYYDLRYSRSTISEGNFYQATQFDIGHSPATPPAIETVTIDNLEEDTWYWFALKVGDEVPNWSAMSNPFGIKTSDTIKPNVIDNLYVYSIDDNSLLLRWTAPGDNGTSGQASYYQVYYTTDTLSGWSRIASPPTPATAGSDESMTIAELTTDMRYWIRIRALDEEYNAPDWSEKVSAIVGDTEYGLPDMFSLAQNYPNPFNPDTRIKYVIGKAGHVNLTIYNIQGQKVKNFVNWYQENGEYEIVWRGLDQYGRKVTSGIYFYRLLTNDYSATRKMILLK